MLATLLGVLLKFLADMAEHYVGEKQQQATDQQLGAKTQALATETQANVIVQEAEVARDAVQPLTADQLRAIAPNTDPDFRD